MIKKLLFLFIFLLVIPGVFAYPSQTGISAHTSNYYIGGLHQADGVHLPITLYKPYQANITPNITGGGGGWAGILTLNITIPKKERGQGYPVPTTLEIINGRGVITDANISYYFVEPNGTRHYLNSTIIPRLSVGKTTLNSTFRLPLYAKIGNWSIEAEVAGEQDSEDIKVFFMHWWVIIIPAYMLKIWRKRYAQRKRNRTASVVKPADG